MGLSIAREITQAHGGTILISSEVGKGTEVIVKLPVVKESQQMGDEQVKKEVMRVVKKA